jgi:hypothetical protein
LEGHPYLLSSGAPDSPMRHRTTTVACPVRNFLPNWAQTTVAAPGPLAHWTVQCPHRLLELPRVTRRFRGRPLALATVGSPDSPVNYSRTPSSNLESGEFTANQPGAPDTVRCTTGQSGVPDRAEAWLHRAKSFPFPLFFFSHCF